MKLSTRARYALRMILDVAKHGTDGSPVSLTQVAERTDLSRGYLEQLAASLRAARLLRSVAGRHGGYKLTRSPSQITIGEVIEATIGPVCLVECLEHPDSCLKTPFCECRLVYALINHRIAEVLHGFTLADLLDPAWVRTMGAEVAALTASPVRSLYGLSANRRQGGGPGNAH